MRAALHHIEPLTETIRTFWFEPERAFRFTAGQFSEFTLPHPHPDERGTKRWFTLSSSPGNPLISITTRVSTEHSSSFKRALSAMQPGDSIEMAEAMGDFVLPKLVQTPLIFIAGGIGITPFHSMFEWLAERREQRDIRFFYAVNSEDDIVFQDTFERANIHATIIVSQPSAAWGGERGRLSADMVLGMQPLTDDTLIYISGPEQMVESLQKEFKQRGIDKRQLVGDFFPGYSAI